jgi:hypothetical protein
MKSALDLCFFCAAIFGRSLADPDGISQAILWMPHGKAREWAADAQAE